MRSSVAAESRSAEVCSCFPDTFSVPTCPAYLCFPVSAGLAYFARI